MATTPNMLLTIPAVGVTEGPEYAVQVNTSLTLIDVHDHSPGRGVQITPDGLNINAPFSIGNNPLLNVNAVSFSQVASYLTPASTYVINNELYYRDGVGNQVQITLAGSVNAGAGTITGLPSGTASAAFDSIGERFIFRSSTNTGAFIDASSYVMRNHIPGSNALTLDPPAAMPANYTITLPTLPVSKKMLTMTSTGVQAADYDTDNVTLEVSGNNLRIKDGGVTLAKMANNSVDTAQLVNSSVTTAKIAAGAVTDIKLAINSVTNPAIGPKAVSIGQVQDTYYITQSFGSGSTTSGTTLITSISGIGIPAPSNFKPVLVMLQGTNYNNSPGFFSSSSGSVTATASLQNIAGTITYVTWNISVNANSPMPYSAVQTWRANVGAWNNLTDLRLIFTVTGGGTLTWTAGEILLIQPF